MNKLARYIFSLALIFFVFNISGCATVPLSTLVSEDNGAGLLKKLERGLDPNVADESGDSLLILAIKAENSSAVGNLLRFGANAKLTDTSGRPPLYWSLLEGNEEITSMLVDAGASGADIRDADITEIICSLAATQNLERIILLPAKPAHVNSACNQSSSALYMALRNKDQRGVNILLEKGASVDAPIIENKHSPLVWAIHNNQKYIFQALIALGADLDNKDRVGWTPLSISLGKIAEDAEYSAVLLQFGVKANGVTFDVVDDLLHENHANTFAEILGAGMNPNLSSSDGEPILFRAISNDCLTCADVLLTGGASPNPAEGTNNYSTLVISIAKGYSGLTAALLEKGANPNIPHDGVYPIDLAEVVLLDDAILMNMILKAGLPNRNARGMENFTVASYSRFVLNYLGLLSDIDYSRGAWDKATIHALKSFQAYSNLPRHGYPSTSTIEALWGAYVRESDNKFIVNCAKGNYKEVQSEIEANSQNVKINDPAGWNCLMHAIYNGHPNTAILALHSGSEVNQKATADGNTPLMLAVGLIMEDEKRHKELIDELLRYEADPEITNNNNWNAKDIASYRSGWIADSLHVGTVKKANNMNVAVLSKRQNSRVSGWSCARDFPAESIKEYWDVEFRIESVYNISGVWCVLFGNTVHDNNGYQSYKIFDSNSKREIAAQIEEWWNEGRVVSSASENNGTLILVASQPDERIDDFERYVWIQGDELGSWINEAWESDLYLTTVFQASDGLWFAHASRYDGYRNQTWFFSKEFPIKTIEEKWEKGYNITSLTFNSTSKGWFVVFSTGAGIEDQRLVAGDFKNLYRDIKSYKSKGWELDALGGYALE